MLLNINATCAFILCFFTILNQNEFRIATVAMFTCDLYAGSPPPHDLQRLRTTMQRRVVDFVRVGYFIPLNGPLNGHPPSIYTIILLKSVGFRKRQVAILARSSREMSLTVRIV